MAKFANILNDEAFKVVIFTPGNEELVARMIELLIPGKRIKHLTFINNEQHGLAVSDKNSNFDAICTSDTDEQFIVEMQGLPQKSYADRMLCYASFPIRMQMEKKLGDIRDGKIGHMDYSLLPIYVISLVNFKIEHCGTEILEDGLISRYSVCSEKTGELMTGSLQFVYLEVGRLNVPFGHPGQCRNLAEQFCYSLRYMTHLTERPAEFEDKFFMLLYNACEYAKMDVKTQMDVNRIMRTEIDRIAENDFAREQGFKQGQVAIATAMLKDGVPVETVVKYTGLSVEDIQAL